MTTIQLNEEIAKELASISSDEGLLRKVLAAIRKITVHEADTTMEEALSSPAMLKVLRDGKAEIASGNVQTVKLEDLWK